MLNLTPFRAALLFEILANASSLPGLLLYPSTTLSYLLTGPSQITPATQTFAQVFGGLVSALTVPLVLSWPNPRPGREGDYQRGVRRAAYITLGAGEFFLAAVFGVNYLTNKGDTGMTETAQLLGAANMVVLLGLRGYFLVVRPDLLEGRDEVEKKTA